MSEREPEQREITLLLTQWRDGSPEALDSLVPLIYDHLKLIARRYVSLESQNLTLSATGLVHESYLRLYSAEVPWQDRFHFYSVASRVMRRLLVDHARSQGRQRRGAGAAILPLDDSIAANSPLTEDIVVLNDLLEKLALVDANKATVVDLIYFGGLTQAEAAAAMGISEQAVFRHLRLARAWLHQALGESS